MASTAQQGNLNHVGDGDRTMGRKDLAWELEQMEILREAGRYGAKKPHGEDGVLAPVRVQNGLQSSTIDNAEGGVRRMGELVQRYATVQ